MCGERAWPSGQRYRGEPATGTALGNWRSSFLATFAKVRTAHRTESERVRTGPDSNTKASDRPKVWLKTARQDLKITKKSSTGDTRVTCSRWHAYCGRPIYLPSRPAPRRRRATPSCSTTELKIGAPQATKFLERFGRSLCAGDVGRCFGQRPSDRVGETSDRRASSAKVSDMSGHISVARNIGRHVYGLSFLKPL